MEAAGAVIFGHNVTLHWHWPDEGDPMQGGSPPLEAGLTAVSQDEGDTTSSVTQPPSTPAS